MTSLTRINQSSQLKLGLDVDIRDPGIELAPTPNQTYIGNGYQYQSGCLDVDTIAS